jgi:hypothetical protein
MATFYGTVQGSRGKATRLGHSHLDLTAQSYEGSIVVRLYVEQGVQHASICVSQGSTEHGTYNLFRGPIRTLYEDSKQNFNLMPRIR